MLSFFTLLAKFRRDESGVFAVFFALIAIVLIATSGAVVDFAAMQTARSQAQNALDAAALALQAKMTATNSSTIQASAQALLTERLANSRITATITSTTIDMTNGLLNFKAQIIVPTVFLQLVGVREIPAQLQSEVTRSSSDLEVSVALDTTGSMSGTKLSDLISATNTLIDLVVQTTQTPTYSKMAIVPWTQAVNVGSTYSTAIRGQVTGPSQISSATWMSGSSKTIASVSKGKSTAVSTTAAHGFIYGDYIYISNVSGMTEINNTIYKVGTVSSTTIFEVLATDGTAIDSKSWSKFSSSGTPKVTKCLNSACQVLITTASAHGHTTGDTIVISGVTGMTALNGTHVGTVGVVPSATTYYLTDEDADSVLYSAYSGSGSSYCTKYGCTYYYFLTAAGGYSLYQINNCATERQVNAYSDTPPSASKLGMNYINGGSDCIGQTILPLTSNKTTLHAMANSLVASNSTGGHLGLGWGWYMISPNFGYLWPTASQPAAYGTSHLVKAVVLMTDGQFNIQYCNGVLSRDSINGSSSQKINCDAPNGSSLNQAIALCNAIKAPANNIELYTVGFDLGSDTASLDFLQNCATDSSHFFRADTGTDLTNAFKSIAQKLQELRISK